MPEPDWTQASGTNYGYPRVWWKKYGFSESRPKVVEKFHLLSCYSEDTDSLASSKCEDPFELPVLSPDGPVNHEYKVVVPTWVHEEFQTEYMIKHDPIHYERRYTVWFGIDLDRFGPIDTPARFFQVLEMSLLSERVVLQDNVPLMGPLSPRRELWMLMHGYFGNWYEPEGKKWAVLAAKRRTRLLKKLWERGDVRITNEIPHRSPYPAKWRVTGPEVQAARGFDFEGREIAEERVIFRDLYKKEMRLLYPEKWGKEGDHCVLA